MAKQGKKVNPRLRPTPEGLVEVVRKEGSTSEVNILSVEPPPREMVCAAITAVFSRPGTSHPIHMTREETATLLKVSFDLAEESQKEFTRRYG